MNDKKIDLNCVEQDERWLREILEPVREIGTAAIKHRVRIAVQEEWLRVQLGAADAGPSISRTRKAVRTAINDAAEAAVRQHVTNEKKHATNENARPLSLSPWERTEARALVSIRLSTWLRIGLAVAAVLALVLIVPRFAGNHVRENSMDGITAQYDRIATTKVATGVNDAIDSASDTADLAAWTRTADENAADELDREIESLRVEFDAAGQTIVEGWSSDPTDWDDILEEDTAEGS